MRSLNINRMLNAAVDFVLGCAVVARVELRALTITGREVSIAPTMPHFTRHLPRACQRKQAPAAWRAMQAAVTLLQGVAVSRGSKSAGVRIS